MTSFSFATENNPEWDTKMEATLLKEVETLTGVPADLKSHRIYAKNEETVVGGINVEHHGNILWIDSIWVELNFRKRGVGRMLLQETQVFGIQNKAKEMQLNTYFQQAQAFFLAFGFENVARIPNWKWGLECYLMRKML